MPIAVTKRRRDNTHPTTSSSNPPPTSSDERNRHFARDSVIGRYELDVSPRSCESSASSFQCFNTHSPPILNLSPNLSPTQHPTHTTPSDPTSMEMVDFIEPPVRHAVASPLLYPYIFDVSSNPLMLDVTQPTKKRKLDREAQLFPSIDYNNNNILTNINNNSNILNNINNNNNILTNITNNNNILNNITNNNILNNITNNNNILTNITNNNNILNNINNNDNNDVINLSNNNNNRVGNNNNQPPILPHSTLKRKRSNKVSSSSAQQPLPPNNNQPTLFNNTQLRRSPIQRGMRRVKSHNYMTTRSTSSTLQQQQQLCMQQQHQLSVQQILQHKNLQLQQQLQQQQLSMQEINMQPLQQQQQQQVQQLNMQQVRQQSQQQFQQVNNNNHNNNNHNNNNINQSSLLQFNRQSNNNNNNNNINNSQFSFCPISSNTPSHCYPPTTFTDSSNPPLSHYPLLPHFFPQSASSSPPYQPPPPPPSSSYPPQQPQPPPSSSSSSLPSSNYLSPYAITFASIDPHDSSHHHHLPPPPPLTFLSPTHHHHTTRQSTQLRNQLYHNDFMPPNIMDPSYFIHYFDHHPYLPSSPPLLNNNNNNNNNNNSNNNSVISDSSQPPSQPSSRKNSKVNISIVPSSNNNNMVVSNVMSNNGDGGLDEMGEMPEIRKYKKKFNTDIHCAALWGVNLLIGTENGLMFLDRSGQGEVYSLINRRRFQQLEVIEAYNLLVTISGKKDKIRMYNLSWLKNKILKTDASDKKVGFMNLSDLQDCVHFKIIKYDKIRFLVVGVGDCVEVYAWAPKPYSKFMLYKSFSGLVNRPLLVDLTIETGDRMKVIYGSCHGFHSIDIGAQGVFGGDGGGSAVLDLFIASPLDKVITPHAIIIMPESNGLSLLLCYDNEGVYMDTYGRQESNIPLQWGECPSSVAYIGNKQVMGWGHKAIEIRSLEGGEMDGVFMHKKAQKLKFLCEKNDKVFFSSARGTSSSQIYFMTLNRPAVGMT